MAAGRSSDAEAEGVKQRLEQALGELEDARIKSEALEARLGPLEKNWRQAETAKENLTYGKKYVVVIVSL